MAVPFVNSHDVSRNENAIQYNVPLAYAVILAMSGTPCVYFSDLWRAGKTQREQLEKLMRARPLAVGEEISRWEDETTLALERSGSLLAAFHSGGVAEERERARHRLEERGFEERVDAHARVESIPTQTVTIGPSLIFERVWRECGIAAMRERTTAPSRPQASNTKRSKLEAT